MEQRPLRRPHRGAGRPDARGIEAANVLLADGGFQGNPDLVRRFISPRPEALTQRNAGSGAGDALLMAEEAGARLTDATSFYGHLLSRDSLTNAGALALPHHGHARRRRHHGRPHRPPFHRRRARRHCAFERARAPCRSACRNRDLRPGDLGHHRPRRAGAAQSAAGRRPAARSSARPTSQRSPPRSTCRRDALQQTIAAYNGP